MVNKAARGPDLTYVTFGPIKNFRRSMFQIELSLWMDFFNCLIGGGTHKVTSVISVEIASDLMNVLKIR